MSEEDKEISEKIDKELFELAKKTGQQISNIAMGSFPADQNGASPPEIYSRLFLTTTLFINHLTEMMLSVTGKVGKQMSEMIRKKMEEDGFGSE